MHVGDLVENWDSTEQWQNAEEAFLPLAQAGIPVTFVPGNHDFSGSNLDNYKAYFGAGSAYADAMNEYGNELYLKRRPMPVRAARAAIPSSMRAATAICSSK